MVNKLSIRGRYICITLRCVGSEFLLSERREGEKGFTRLNHYQPTLREQCLPLPTHQIIERVPEMGKEKLFTIRGQKMGTVNYGKAAPIVC